MTWTDLMPRDVLDESGEAVARVNGRQILVLKTREGIFAVNNRCPHEGYPLSEGARDGCVLTCNWHNWKFDLATGETLVGGDSLRRYPVRIEEGRVQVDITEPSSEEIRRKVETAVVQALADQDQARLLRETARLELAGIDPLDAVRTAIVWGHDRMQYGMNHAYAVAPDWLALRDRAGLDGAEKLACLGEILGHISETGRVGDVFPFSPDVALWNEAALLDAIEREDEPAATAILRGGLAAGLTVDALEPVFAQAALAHYQDFGHSAIYTGKAAELVRHLGDAVAEPVFLALTRSLIFATREDLIPEFRFYTSCLTGWGEPVERVPPLEAGQLRGSATRNALGVTVGWGSRHAPEDIYVVLLEAVSWNLLHADTAHFDRTDIKLADNAGWLDFTHAITFAEAAGHMARTNPELWPQVLLQLACFVGRNAGFVAPSVDPAPWAVEDRAAFFSAAHRRLLDHGMDLFIVSAHLVKTLEAARRLSAGYPAVAPVLLAAINRFIHSPIKRRHVLRDARQMRAFVASE